MKKIKHNYKKQGKANRTAGQRFELKVRHDLESKGWIVDKWSNNVETEEAVKVYSNEKDFVWWAKEFYPNSKTDFWCKKLIPAKRKFNPFNKVMTIGTGFPDFISFRKRPEFYCEGYEKCKRCGQTWFVGKKVPICKESSFYNITGIEAKSNGILSKEEKEKCKWLLDNNIFSKILIAKKGIKRGEIIYEDFEK